MLGAGLISIAAVAVSVAWAAIPGGDGVIHSCVKHHRLRVIDAEAGESCKRAETPLAWNQTGLRGLPGPPGPPGEQGAAGAPGRDGQSVTQAPADAAACPDGGVALTAANGTGNVCNGADGEPGPPGSGGLAHGYHSPPAPGFLHVGADDTTVALTLGGASARIQPTPGDLVAAPMSLTAFVHLDAPAEVALVCSNFGTQDVTAEAFERSIRAIEIADFTTLDS